MSLSLEFRCRARIKRHGQVETRQRQRFEKGEEDECGGGGC